MARYKTLYTIEIGLGSLSQEGLAIFYHWTERYISSKRIENQNDHVYMDKKKLCTLSFVSFKVGYRGRSSWLKPTIDSNQWKVLRH